MKNHGIKLHAHWFIYEDGSIGLNAAEEDINIIDHESLDISFKSPSEIAGELKDIFTKAGYNASLEDGLRYKPSCMGETLALTFTLAGAYDNEQKRAILDKLPVYFHVTKDHAFFDERNAVWQPK